MRSGVALPVRHALAVLALVAGCAAPEVPGAVPGETARMVAGAVPAVQAAPLRPMPDRAAGFLDSSATDVVATLGRPDLRRPEGSAEVWLYAAPDGCRLDLVLFRDGGTARVAHAQARVPKAGSETACLRRIAGRG